MPVGRTKKDKKTKTVKPNIDIELVKVSTRYMLGTKTSDGHMVYVTAKYNHIEDTVNIYPQQGSGFRFKHSDPAVARSVAHLIEAAAEMAEKI